MKNIFEVISFEGLLRIEQLEEFLDKLRCDIDFKRLNIHSFIDNQLQEKFINTLDMGPNWVNLIFLFDSSFRESKVFLLNVGQGSEDVAFNHLHDLVEVGDDQ